MVRRILKFKEARMTRSDTQYRVSERLDRIHMTAAEREAARTYLQWGASAADVAMQICARLRSIGEHVGRRVRGLARFTH
jgi:hypothetical protein